MDTSSDTHPPPPCEAFFRGLHDQCGQVLAESLHGERLSTQAASHAFVDDIKKWCDAVGSDSESDALAVASREYEFALLALLQGHYRHAFIGLRLSLELSLAFIHFRSNRLESREWSGGRLDVAWARLVDEENGVLSKRFASAFFGELVNDVPHYNVLARKVYRECSEYVHGNPRANELLSAPLMFNSEAFDRWHQHADVVALVVSFALSLAFLGDLDDEARESLESTALDRVRHVTPIRALLGGAVETEQ